MKTINVPTRDQVSAESQVMFDTFTKRVGKVPNLYATMGYSAPALKMFMDMEDDMGKSVFTPKEREAIALIVSEINGCAYCLAGHSMLAIKRGFTKEQTLDIRRGHTDDDKLNAIVGLAKSIVENKGKADETSLNDFYAAGFDEAALMDLIAFITIRVYTNYVFANTEIPVDFPAADPIN
ncbi:carboxymuconolactone decarboxylase family protein [Mucilaginibacter endophyticus]|uniref:carboxymuconolactone decarboxylase family protein n=1 Tax=Mucilaginibacter endophyticus TaxID=2675003 RepID=UPI000E0D35FD|nr:carboxymuconolactone decarboxylase family protein [Mucilaginibacter endophyticus]